MKTKAFEVCGRCGRNETTEDQCGECDAKDPRLKSPFTAEWFDGLAWATSDYGFELFCRASADALRAKAKKQKAKKGRLFLD